MEHVLFQIISVIAVFVEVSTGAVCDAYSDMTKYTKSAAFGEHCCYFIVKDATSASNTPLHYQEGSKVDLFVFDIDKAQSICAQHSAALPVIHDEKEEDFIGKNFVGPDFDKRIRHDFLTRIALGISVEVTHRTVTDSSGEARIKYDYTLICNDGSDLPYQPPRRRISVDFPNATYVYLWQPLREDLWMLNADVQPLGAPMGVLCQHIPSAGSISETDTRIDIVSCTAFLAFYRLF